MAEHDVVIRGGNVVDGTGSSARTADIGIDGDRITAVGSVGSGATEIDADGALVTPGFVDMHTHFDAQVTWDPYLTPSGWHGVTSVVMGNCGVGFAPAAPDKRDWLIGLMEGVEDIPGAAMHEGITWAWETFPEYLDAIESMDCVLDYGTQIPHGALRAYVMGERGADNETATAADISQMQALVAEALDAGALGFSTSRTPLHKSIDGVLVPGTFAGNDELFGIGAALKSAGHGVFQYAPEHIEVEAEFDWMRPLAAELGRPVVFNFSQTDQQPTYWRKVLGLLEQAAADDLPVFGQCAGRAIGVLMGWECTVHPFVGHPTYRAIADLPIEHRITERQFLADIRTAIPNHTQTFWDMTIAAYWAWSECWSRHL